ncbi:hypothetical protein EC988_004640 [Linderina pennispora]|nr:hypothetical protein EC988_004640 [Linderina pennispora]
MFFRNYNSNVFGTAPGTPSDEWCITTLRTMSAKYDHLSESRKVKPALAEAVLNSFKAKLSALYREHPLYDTDDSSEGEAEWPIVGDYSQYMDLKSNSLSAVDGQDILDSTPFDESILAANPVDEITAGLPLDGEDVALMSPSPSPTGSGDSAYSDLCSSEGKVVSDEEVKATSKGIDEALRRILSSTSRELLSMNFSTFPTSATASAEQVSTATTVTPMPQQELSDEDDQDQAFADSGHCSPSSPPESADDFGSAAESFDMYVEDCAQLAVASDAKADAPEASSAAKRKRDDDAADEDEDGNKPVLAEAAPCGRAILVAGPRKRARSATASDDNSVLAIAIPATGEEK